MKYLITLALGIIILLVGNSLIKQQQIITDSYLSEANFQVCQRKWNIKKRYLIYEDFDGNDYCPWQSSWTWGDPHPVDLNNMLKIVPDQPIVLPTLN